MWGSQFVQACDFWSQVFVFSCVFAVRIDGFPGDFKFSVFAVTVAGQRFGVGAVKPRKVCAKRQKSDGKFFPVDILKKNDIIK